MSPAHAFAQVLLDTSLPQLDHLFDYEVPSELLDRVQVGQRVRVPLRAGARQSFGYIISLKQSSDFQGSVSAITDLVSEVPVLSPRIAKLARTLADRAAGSASDILRLAIPPRQVRAEKTYLTEFGMPAPQELVFARDRKLVRESLTPPAHPVRLSTGEWVPGWATTVAQLASEVISRDESVIITVPDQYDIEFIIDTLHALEVPPSVIRVDAQQSNAARYTNFLRALGTQPHVIVGNRSAVYSPIGRLGAIVIVDDGDSLYEEPLAPYVHTRDAALVRSELEDTDLYFVASSRSLEVHRLVKLGYVRGAAAPPRSSSVVLTESVASERTGQRLPSLALSAMRDGLKDGPVLVQVPNPGFATAIFCGSCAERQRCTRCGGPLELTTAANSGRCRWCQHTVVDHRCASCGNNSFRQVGAGSSRTAEQFAQQFPGVRVLTSDGDSRRLRIDSRPTLVVATRGTEPLAATGYAAVVLLDAEQMLSAPALRAEEEALRVWSNASALARQGAKIVLTEAGGLLASAFALGTPEKWLDSVLAERKALRYPPAVRVASLTGPPATLDAAERALNGLIGYDVIHASNGRSGDEDRLIRFDYAIGQEVAVALRQALVANATVSRRRTREPQTSRLQSSLRLHFDDPAAFDERIGRRASKGTRSDTLSAHPTDLAQRNRLR